MPGMSDGLRVLHLADTHIGAGLVARPRRAVPRRGDDLVASYRAALASASREGVDLVIHAGDLFDNTAPGSGALGVAAEPLRALASAGVPVVIVPGNHERSAVAESLLLSHENIHVLAEPRTVRLELGGVRVAVAGFPCVRRGAEQGFPGALESTGWRRVAADVRILAVHQTFAGAAVGPTGFRFRPGRDVVFPGAVPAEFDYVAAGHVHRHPGVEIGGG